MSQIPATLGCNEMEQRGSRCDKKRGQAPGLGPASSLGSEPSPRAPLPRPLFGLR